MLLRVCRARRRQLVRTVYSLVGKVSVVITQRAVTGMLTCNWVSGYQYLRELGGSGRASSLLPEKYGKYTSHCAHTEWHGRCLSMRGRSRWL